MTASISEESRPLTLPTEDVLDEPLSLWKTAAVGESLLLMANTLSVGACMGIGIATCFHSPLILFAAATTLPIVYCLSIIFNDPYYEDPRKREQYRSDILAIGLEKFIEKHGWEKLDQYGFLLKGSSPLITPEAYAEAFFQTPRASDSSLLWEGLERGLFLKSDYPKIEKLILPDVRRLIHSEKIWKAIDAGLFSSNRDQLRQELSQFFRRADGFELLLIWRRLRDAGLVPQAFPCANWAESKCFSVEIFMQKAEEKRRRLKRSFAQDCEVFKSIAEQDRESVFRGRLNLIKSISVTNAPEHLLLQSIERKLHSRIKSAKAEFERALEQIDQSEREERAQIAASYSKSQREHPFYFSFERLSLQAFIDQFGIQKIDHMRASCNFPSIRDWSERFIEESNPPIVMSLERGYLNERAKRHLEAYLLERFSNPWELFESCEFKKALEAQLFSKEVLIERASKMEPMEDPLRLLRIAFILDKHDLCPADWQIKFPWIKKLSGHFHSQEQYFERRKMAVGSDFFLEEQQQRWHREVLRSISGSLDPYAFEKDLDELSLDAFISKYGWDFIEEHCLSSVRDHFFSNCKMPEDQMKSPIFWTLAQLEALSKEQKHSASAYLLKEFPLALESGLISRAIESDLFDERTAFQEALSEIDPREQRDALIQLWPKIKERGLIPDSLSSLASWFDHSKKRTLEEFEESYLDYSLRRKWKSAPLFELFDRYGIDAFVDWGLNDPDLIFRLEQEDPTWSHDTWNWKLLEKGLLPAQKRDEWMSSWLKRHPTFREKIVLPEFWKAFNEGLFSKQHLDLIANSLHHPTTFLFASEWIEHLDEIAELPLVFNPEEKLLYNWLKNHQSRQGGALLDREFAAYKQQIGWIGEGDFEVGLEKKEFIEERSHPLRKIFRGG